MKDLQLTAEGKLRHFLAIQGLPAEILYNIMDTAKALQSAATSTVKKVPLLHGKTIVTLFFEDSTRTRTTFELAAKRLSADYLNFNIRTSSTSKGETLMDTLYNLEAMQCDMFIVRHSQSGAPFFIAGHVPEHISIINAGDGCHEHPTQAMLDAYTIREHKPDFSQLRIAIVGDILHSRVARSEIYAFTTLGVKEIRVIAPTTLLPPQVDALGVRVYHSLREGVRAVDVIIMLRLQKERMEGALLPSEQEYFNHYGLSEEILELAAPDALVMHPGPINRGVEIESKVADGPSSVILEQVNHGIAVRMAIMAMVLGRAGDPKLVREDSVP